MLLVPPPHAPTPGTHRHTCVCTRAHTSRLGHEAQEAPVYFTLSPGASSFAPPVRHPTQWPGPPGPRPSSTCVRASPALPHLYSQLPLLYPSCVDFSQSSVVQGTETHSSWFRNDVWEGAGGWAMDSQEEIEILGHSQDSQRGGTWNRECGSYSFWGWKPRISLGVSGLLCMPAPSSSFC